MKASANSSKSLVKYNFDILAKITFTGFVTNAWYY